MSEAQVKTNGNKLFAAGRNLWLAGLGVAAEVEEGGRELLGRLVERGRPVEERRKRAVEAVAGRVRKAAGDLGKLLEETVDYEGRGVLKRLNVMTREDLAVFSARLATLETKIGELNFQTTTAASQPKAPKAQAAPRPRNPKPAAGKRGGKE